jgi:hypothetical protein
VTGVAACDFAVDTTAEGKRLYSVGGQRIASVTTILKIVHDEEFAKLRGDLGNERFWAIMNGAADLGTAVHEGITDALDPEGIPLPAVDTRVGAMVDGALRWIEAQVKEVHHVEVGFADTALGYAGTIDFICTLKGDRRPCVLDWKTSSKVLPIYKLQLAAYREAARASIDKRIDRRLVIQISKDKARAGHIRVHEYADHAADFAAFQNALNLFRWTKEYA